MFVVMRFALVILTACFTLPCGGHSTFSSSIYISGKSRLIALRIAISAYESAYGFLPFPDHPEDREFLASQYDELVADLRGGNPRQIRFLERAGDGHLDPWGHRPKVLLDSNGDGQISIDGVAVAERVLIYSFGKNGVDEGGAGDDIASWKEFTPRSQGHSWRPWLIAVPICLLLSIGLSRLAKRLRDLRCGDA